MSLQKIAHVINPVLVSKTSDLFIAQPITFESMRIARQRAGETVAVDLLALGYPEDQAIMPDGFHILPPLTRSVLDVVDFPRQRKLPLLKDVLSTLYAHGNAEFCVYTNVDIGLQPGFYLAVRDIVERGYEAFVINRRTISDDYETITQLPEMWADKGKAHRGWDCFVYRRDLFPAMILGDICIGAPRVGMALIANLIAVAESFFEFTDEHLTFHIGDDRSWRSSPFQPYIDHNTRELDEILVLLEAQYGRFPRHTPPGAYLWKRRTFGTLYESWSRRAYLPASWSKRVHRLFGKLSGNS